MNCDRIPGAKHIPSSQNSFAYFFYKYILQDVQCDVKLCFMEGADMPIYIFIYKPVHKEILMVKGFHMARGITNFIDMYY